MRLLAALKLISGLWFGSGLRSQSQGQVRRTRWREESSHSVPNSNASAKSLFSRSSSGRDCCPLLEAHTHTLNQVQMSHMTCSNLETVLLFYQLYFTRKFIQIHTYMYTHLYTHMCTHTLYTLYIHTHTHTISFAKINLSYLHLKTSKATASPGPTLDWNQLILVRFTL